MKCHSGYSEVLSSRMFLCDSTWRVVLLLDSRKQARNGRKGSEWQSKALTSSSHPQASFFSPLGWFLGDSFRMEKDGLPLDVGGWRLRSRQRAGGKAGLTTMLSTKPLGGRLQRRAE